MAKKMANEDVSLLFTAFCNLPHSGNRKSSSLKKQSFFFTSSPNHREYLLVHRSLVRRWMKTFH
ncbi:MAG: hypothetical protein IJC27_04785, partial [Lentisphaeria bacterium]|nr:hypothetical protein [Lentisphaeria bacterium]